MTEKEASKYLVELYADYEYRTIKMNHNIHSKYSEAVAMAIMALKQMEDAE